MDGVELGTVAVARDAEAEKFVRDLFASSPIAYQIFDGAGRHLFANDAYRRLFGDIPGPDFDIRDDERIQDPMARELVSRIFKGEAHVLPKLWFYGEDRGWPNGRLAIESTGFPMLGAQG